ncbi:hypothetical protein D3C80_1221250 [compost metagenome]
MGVYMQSLQASSEDYGDPDAANQFGDQDGDARDRPPVPGKQPGQPDAADEEPEDHGEAMQKAFGLPVWRVEP